MMTSTSGLVGKAAGWASDQGSCLQRAPLVLALLVVLGIMVPLGIAARYLMTSTRYTGPNSVMAETMDIFFRCACACACAYVPDAFQNMFLFFTRACKRA